MRIVVFGGTGYLGRALERHQVVGLSRSTGCDVRDRGSVREALRTYHPDVVINAAAVQGADEWKTNVTGAAIVAEETRGTHLIQVSSDLVFGAQGLAPYTEEDAPSPATAYGASKAAAEAIVADRRARHGCSIVRLSLLYGLGDGAHEQAASDPASVFYTDEIRCPTDVRDVAAALVALATLRLCGVFHLVGGAAVSRHAFAAFLAGRPVTGAKRPEGRPGDCRLVSTKLPPLPGVPL